MSAEMKPLERDLLTHTGNYPDGSTFWVAAPGVRPIAMTAERVDTLYWAIRECFGDLRNPLDGERERVLRALLAEARGEA